MSTSKPTTPEDSDDQARSSRDSRLESFLRQAAPILAAERGMNETCRLKLQALAEGLRLPKALYDRGISELNRSSQISQLTRTEQQFVQFLERELNKLPGGILSANAETKAIQIGETKYQIPAVRARKIVRQCVSARDIRRVSRTEAENHLKSMYRELLSSARSTHSDQAQRLIEIGQQWGLNPEESSAILQQIIGANPFPQTATVPRRQFAIVGAVVILALIAIAIFVVRSRNQNPVPEKIAENSNATSVETNFQPPKWWSGELYQAVVKSIESNPILRHTFLAATNLSPETRRTGYLQLSALAKDSPSQQPVSAPALAAALLAAEPDPSIVGMVVGEWASKLTPQNSSTLSSVSEFDLSARAAALLAELWILKRETPVGKQIENFFAEAWGIYFAMTSDPANFQQQITTARLAAFWNHLIQSASTNPRAAAALFKRLQALDSENMEQEQQALLTMLTADASLWGELHDVVERHIAVENAAGLLLWLEWADLKQQPELSESILETIARRLKVLELDGDFAHKVATVRAALMPTSAKASEIKTAWGIVAQKKRALIDHSSFSNLPEPQKLANAAYVATLAFLLHNSDRQAVENLTKFDALVARDVRNIMATRENLDHKTELSFRQVNKPATAIERQQLEQAIARFSNETAKRSTQFDALFSLAEVADRFGDLAYPEATSLIRFLSSIDNSAELAEVEQAIARMRHWPNLSLAWIDSLESAVFSATSATRIYFGLFGKDAKLNRPEMWRDELRTLGLRNVSTSIESALDASADSPSRQWRELETYVEELLIQRFSIHRTTSLEIGHHFSDMSLSNQIQIQLIQQFESNSPPTDEPEFLRASDLVINRFDQSLPRIVFLEELLANSLAGDSAEFPKASARDNANSRRTLAQRFLDAEIQIIERLLLLNQ